MMPVTTISTSKDSRNAELVELRKKQLTKVQTHDLKNAVQTSVGQPIPMDTWFSHQRRETEKNRKQKQDATQNLRSYRPQGKDQGQGQDTSNLKEESSTGQPISMDNWFSRKKEEREEIRKQKQDATQNLRSYRPQGKDQGQGQDTSNLKEESSTGQPISMDNWFFHQKEETEKIRRQKDDATQNLRSYRPQGKDQGQAQDTSNLKEELKKKELEATQLLRSYRCQPQAFLPHQAGNTPERVSAIVNAAHEVSTSSESVSLVPTGEQSDSSKSDGVSLEEITNNSEQKDQITTNPSATDSDKQSIRKSSSASDWIVLSEKFHEKDKQTLVDPSVTLTDVGTYSSVMPQLLQTDQKREMDSDSSYSMPSNECEDTSEKKSLGGSSNSYVFASDGLAHSANTIETKIETSLKQSSCEKVLDDHIKSNTNNAKEILLQLDSPGDKGLITVVNDIQTKDDAVSSASPNEQNKLVNEETLEDAENNIHSLEPLQKADIQTVEAASSSSLNDQSRLIENVESAESSIQSLEPSKKEVANDVMKVAAKNDITLDEQFESNSNNGKETLLQSDYPADNSEFTAMPAVILATNEHTKFQKETLNECTQNNGTIMDPGVVLDMNKKTSKLSQSSVCLDVISQSNNLSQLEFSEKQDFIALPASSQTIIPKRSVSLNKHTGTESTATAVKELKEIPSPPESRLNRISISIKFGLLTSKDEAPPIGPFQIPMQSKILDALILKMEELVIQSLPVRTSDNNAPNESHKDPIHLSVENDASYQAPLNRPDILRRFVKANISIDLTLGDDNDAAEKIARLALERAISSGSLNTKYDMVP